MNPPPALIEDEWAIIRRLLPDDLDRSARAHGAMQRNRGKITSAEQLLRVILMHVAGGLSLEQTVARSQIRGLATLNAMALHKRLCTSHQWLNALTSHMIEAIKPYLRQNDDFWAIGRRVRILDATDVQEPGSTGTDWRVHYSLRLPEMCCDFFELTDCHGAESLRRLPVDPGDLVLVDRGYNDRKAVAQVLQQGGAVILRYNSTSFPLLDPKGRQRFEPIDKLRSLTIGETGEWDVQFVAGDERKISARVCAVRKSPQQAARSRAKIRRKARGQTYIRPLTLEYADFVVVLTTLNREEMKLPTVLEFYRARWQVELAFKRLKSLLQMGQLPKKKEASCKAWMQGKILTALLIERLICERFFSPWGFPL